MIISRSPLRISFAGGGTDIPEFYENFGPGAVVSTTINKYVYVTLNRKFGGGVSLRYKIHENRKTVEELDHLLIKKTLLEYGINEGVELVIISDVPAAGSGLGASSAMICALVAALEKLTNGRIEKLAYKEQIARIACEIEINRVGSPIGRQDQYASSYGGFNFFKFEKDGTVLCSKFESEDFIKEIESQSMLFYLNIQHTYHNERLGKDIPDTAFVPKIMKEQILEIKKMQKIYNLQRDNAVNLWEHLVYEVPERFIDHVNENWRLKRSVHHEISSEYIDSIIQRAYKAGATAAKVAGAGGGGFVYLVAPRSMQDSVRKELAEFPELLFSFEDKGTQVIFDDSERKEALDILPI